VRSEDAIVSSLRAAFRGNTAKGALNLLDDAALLPPVPKGNTRVVSTDMVVEEIDFALDLYPPKLAGHRLMLQNLSDLAAMGARPVGFVWSLGIPDRWTQGPDLRDFFAGAAALSRKCALPLFGGDLSKTNGPFTASVTVFGDVAGAPLTRSGARPGHDVYVSPSGIGAASTGLAALLSRRKANRPARGSFKDFLQSVDLPTRRAVQSYLSRVPEVQLGQSLLGHASACIDVSDGLGRDLGRLARASGVRIDLSAAALLGARSQNAPKDLGVAALLASAEEYVLAFTSKTVVPGAHKVGHVRRGAGLFIDGQKVPKGGFDHFA
jgi:thiamine-monophosphate kinase